MKNSQQCERWNSILQDAVESEEAFFAYKFHEQKNFFFSPSVSAAFETIDIKGTRKGIINYVLSIVKRKSQRTWKIKGGKSSWVKGNQSLCNNKKRFGNKFEFNVQNCLKNCAKFMMQKTCLLNSSFVAQLIDRHQAQL